MYEGTFLHTTQSRKVINTAKSNYTDGPKLDECI